MNRLSAVAAVGRLLTLAVLLAAALCAQAFAATDPLRPWSDGPARHAIITFVNETTEKAGPNYVPPAERIAVFDNDGTLWPENPMPVQLAYIPRSQTRDRASA